MKPSVEADKVIQDLASKLANAEAKESMVRIYADQLEVQIKAQQERIKTLEEERRGLVKSSNKEDVRKTDAAKTAA